MPDIMTTEDTVLGFDFGQKRIGVAIGYPEVCLASPLKTICAEDSQRRFEAISTLIYEWQPKRLVVGLPAHVDGTYHDMTEQAIQFAEQLEKRFALPVDMIDERYTSIIAEDLLRQAATKKQHKENKSYIDSLSAKIIVQTYLDHCKSIK